jgi:hypothetical protein
MSQRKPFSKHFEQRIPNMWKKKLRLLTLATYSGLGHLYVEKNGKVGDIIPTLNSMAGFEKETPLLLFEVSQLTHT